MTESEFLMKTLKFVLAVSLTLFRFPPVQAQPLNPASGQLPPKPSEQLSEPLVFSAPPPPDNIGEPGRRSEAASRGCGELGNPLTTSPEKLLTALVPVYESQNPELVFGITTAERPTFYFYVPYQFPLAGEFVLRDEDENLIYETEVTLPEMPGIISVSLPSTVNPLEVEQLYHWYFKVKCKQPPIFIDGWIQRNALNPSIESQLENATLQEQVFLYGGEGIWHEALTAAAELRRTNPQDPNWPALLLPIGLEKLASEPIVEP
ncbi:MAG: DUF928 domain-containing protein [Coleofasciculaceae cyanobacterium]